MKDRSDGKRLLIPTFFVLMLGLGGCAELDLAPSGPIFPWEKAKTDVVPGLASPADRIAVVRKLRQKAAWAKPAEQERISGELAAAFADEADPLIRAEIVRAAGGYRTATAASVLRTAVNDSDSDVRVGACEGWGKRGGPEAVEILSSTLASDVDSDVRLAAARALGQTGDHTPKPLEYGGFVWGLGADPRAVAALGKILDDRDPAMQYVAVQSLRNVTGKDFDGDVDRWRQYVRGETPGPKKPVSIAERIRGMF